MPFRDVIGHRRLVELLRQSIERSALPPSLIFAGPAGIGKRLVAMATAQALNCVADRAGSDGDACGTCASCLRIGRGVHPDVLIVEPGESGSIKIDQVRDIIERAAYRPFEGNRRVVIIDDADTLGVPAQSALLKTLEEPPSASAFILITSRPDMLLPTVRSRCPRLRFSALDAADVAAALRKMKKTDSEARALAATADGSIGDAISRSAGDLIALREVAARVLADAATSDDPRRRLEAAQKLVGKAGSGPDRDTLAEELRAMASLVRDVELLSVRGEPRGLANPDAEADLAQLTAFRGPRGLLAFDAIDRALEALERNAGVKTVADWVMLNI